MSEDGAGQPGPATPDEAFALLGDETRLDIVRELGAADDPLAFSALHDRVDVRDSGQFNYHLEKLVGHFVAKTDGGYRLSRAGRRVVEAILSGAVTEEPGLERTAIDETCRYCGADVEIVWRSGSLEMYCTECAGRYGNRAGDGELPGDGGYLGRMPLPPAGLQDRTPDEVLQAAWAWGGLEILAMSAGICPRCSATVDRTVDVCADHDASEGLCPTCEALHRVTVGVECGNCIFTSGGDFAIVLLANTDLLAFLADHGNNPVLPASSAALYRILGDYAEAVHSTDPFHASFTFTAGADTITLTVDDDLEVVSVQREPA